MQMQGSEAVWKLVLDAHLHCVYPGTRRSATDGWIRRSVCTMHVNVTTPCNTLVATHITWMREREPLPSWMDRRQRHSAVRRFVRPGRTNDEDPAMTLVGRGEIWGSCPRPSGRVASLGSASRQTSRNQEAMISSHASTRFQAVSSAGTWNTCH